MLTRSDLDAATLGILEDVRSALITLRGRLERGEIVHDNTERPRELVDYDAPLCAINMAVWHCGSVGCIGGWIEAMTGLSEPKMLTTPQLNDLCYPRGLCCFWSDITPEQIAHAINNYLTTGNPDWKAVMRR